MPGKLWEIIGGADKGGILVRDGQEFTSAQLPARLGTGAVVEEREVVSGRLHFHKVSGSGPEEGWISISVAGKVLAQPLWLDQPSFKVPEAKAPSPAAQPSAHAQPQPKPQLHPPASIGERAVKSTQSWDKHFQTLLRDRPIPASAWEEAGRQQQYASVFAPSGSEVLEERAQHFCLENGVSSCVALPKEALQWDDRECDLWFRTSGDFHARDTTGIFRQGRSASEHHLPRSIPGRVSVITPTTELRHQHHELLWLCFEAQDWPDKELVVVETYNGAPSQFLTELAREDSRVVYIPFQRTGEADISIGVKRNIAIHVSTGEFIAHFDDDDIYAHSYLSVMVGDLQKEKKAVAAKLSTWYLANLKAKFAEGSIVVDPSFALCDPLRLHKQREAGSARDSPAVRCSLYGYGFSYVYYRSVALDMPFADMSGGEDLKFFSKLLDDRGLRSIDLIDDEEGICLHMQHASNLTDCSVCKYEEVKLEELCQLKVALSGAFNVYMNLAGFGDQSLTPEHVQITAALLGMQFQMIQVDGHMCMLAPDGVVYNPNTREALGIYNHETQIVDPMPDPAVAAAASKVVMLPEINVADLDALDDETAEIHLVHQENEFGAPVSRELHAPVAEEKMESGPVYDLDWDDDDEVKQGQVRRGGSVDVWGLD